VSEALAAASETQESLHQQRQKTLQGTLQASHNLRQNVKGHGLSSSQTESCHEIFTEQSSNITTWGWLVGWLGFNDTFNTE